MIADNFTVTVSAIVDCELSFWELKVDGVVQVRVPQKVGKRPVSEVFTAVLGDVARASMERVDDGDGIPF